MDYAWFLYLIKKNHNYRGRPQGRPLHFQQYVFKQLLFFMLLIEGLLF